AVPGSVVIAQSGGAEGDPGAGTSTGAHVHIHDVLPNGVTRAPAFSTISGWAGGDTEPFEENEMEVIPIIFDANRPGKNDSGHPDYGSTGLMWPWGFEQTSQ